MARTTSWWKARRVKHRDAVVLCVLSSAFLLSAGFFSELVPEMSFPEIYEKFLAPVADRPALLLLYTILAVLAFTTAFGVVFVLLGGWYFIRGRVPRGRFFVGFGIGLTSLSLLSRLARATLEQGSPLAFLLPLATSLTGVGILLGVAAHTTMGQYALLLKRHARAAWRRWRRARRAPRRTSRT